MPPDLVADFERACAWQDQGDWAQALAAYEAVLAAAPPGHAVCAPSWANLGMVHEERGQRAQARAAYEAALALAPQAYAARLHLGQWWLQAPPDAEEPDPAAQAELHLQLAARAQPQAAAPWSALGGLLTCLHRDADAEACLRHALALAPDNEAARFNLAYLTLRQGRFDEGWACLESRVRNHGLTRHLPWPRWAGEPLAGRRLLLVNDAGHGDLLQMWRYLPWLHARGASQVSWLVQAPLIPLLSAQPGVGPLHVLGDALPPDSVTGPQAPQVWAPVLSLPWLCAPHAAQAQPEGPGWPQALPYLRVPAPAATPLSPHSPLSPSAPRRRRVGLVWHGNPRHENDAERSLPGLASLAPLLALGQGDGAIDFVNLQPGDPAWPVTDGPLLHDFADAARTLATLDLLITVDTAYAHLAGALGVPVWVMLPQWKTDWRWLTERADSPWYPGVMRLFRQPARGDWASVAHEVAQALTAR
ncbi:MAG: hypothetical protein RI907_562 [Pseudomonadota bacterium]|jgi:Tfp pilus assembly protein PilF